MPTSPPLSNRNPWSGLVVAVTALTVIALDQATKWLIVRALAGADGDGRVGILFPWLSLEYAENRGAAFGLLQGYSNLVLALAIVLVVGITIMFQRMRALSPLMAVAVGLILGGAVGNIIDRLRLGFVIDFVAVGPWPKFNVADSAITVGVVVLFAVLVFGTDDPAPQETRAGELTTGQ